MLHWESERLDVSVPSVRELTMMYTSSRQIRACDVAACRYAFGCLQSSLCGSGTSGALCSMSFLLHIIISSGQTFQTECCTNNGGSVCVCECVLPQKHTVARSEMQPLLPMHVFMNCMYLSFPLPVQPAQSLPKTNRKKKTSNK